MAVVAAVFEPVERETRPMAANAATKAATIPTMIQRSLVAVHAPEPSSSSSYRWIAS